jgi:hypothetical protein
MLTEARSKAGDGDTTQLYAFRINTKRLDALRRIATRDGVTVSQLIRHAIARHVLDDESDVSHGKIRRTDGVTA